MDPLETPSQPLCSSDSPNALLNGPLLLSAFVALPHWADPSRLGIVWRKIRPVITIPDRTITFVTLKKSCKREQRNLYLHTSTHCHIHFNSIFCFLSAGDEVDKTVGIAISHTLCCSGVHQADTCSSNLGKFEILDNLLNQNIVIYWME